jgi:hypothetical protein
MGKGYTSYNVWPISSSNKNLNTQINQDLNVKEDSISKELKIADVLADRLTLLLTPILESMKTSKNEVQVQSKNELQIDLEKKLEESKKTEKKLLIGIIIFGILTFLCFLSAVWSANSVEKLLRILYKLKQSKP